MQEGEQQLRECGLDILLLLLSFTNRTRVQSLQEGFERFEGGEWRSIGGGRRDFPSLGRVRGKQMGGLIGGVEGFVDRSLERLIADEESGEKGIALAMRFLCSNYAGDFIESQYVKTWTALEILGASNCLSPQVFEDEAVYDLLGSKLRAGLRAEVKAHTISAEGRDMLMEKLGDVNRKAISRQITEMAAAAFGARTSLIPTRREVSAFANIRNQIAHAGVVPIPSEEDKRELVHARAHLHGLIERLIVALLGEEADMLNLDWRNHRYQA